MLEINRQLLSMSLILHLAFCRATKPSVSGCNVLRGFSTDAAGFPISKSWSWSEMQQVSQIFFGWKQLKMWEQSVQTNISFLESCRCVMRANGFGDLMGFISGMPGIMRNFQSWNMFFFSGVPCINGNPNHQVSGTQRWKQALQALVEMTGDGTQNNLITVHKLKWHWICIRIYISSYIKLPYATIVSYMCI